MHGVLDDAADVRIVEGTVRLVARLEIEDPAVFTVECAARTEEFAAFIPAHKDHFIGIRYGERFGVRLLMRKLKVPADAFSYRMSRINCPYTFEIAVLAPRKVACSAEQIAERL